MSWNYYAQNEFGLLENAAFSGGLFGYTVAPNDYTIVQGEGGAPLLVGLENQVPWTAGQSIARTNLFYFAQYDTNGNKVGYVGFDISITSDYTILGHNADVVVELYTCIRDLNKTLIQDLGGRQVRSSANSQSFAVFRVGFFLSIGKATDGQTIAVGGAVQIFNRDRLTTTSGYFWAGIVSSVSAWQSIKYSTKEKSPEFGNKSEPKGGYNEDARKKGSFDDSSDKITYSLKPTLSVGNSGFVHAYVVTEQILQAIGTALFPKIESHSFTGIPEAIDYLTMVMFFNKRTDYLMDLLILPFTVPSGAASRVRVGGSELVVESEGEQVYCMAYPVTDYYVDVDCGTLSLDEYWANFLDFTGTRIKLFLPAVGYVDLQTEYVNGGEISVKYRFNIVDGSFMCVVHSTSGHSELDESLIAQYSGVWCMHIPITGQDYTNKISGLISSVGSVAAGGLLGGGVGAVIGGVSSLANVAMQKPQTTHANGYNASSSFLTHRKPYIIIERQVSQFSESYPSETGLPCYVTRQLSSVHGFTVIENPVLNIACSDAEYNELVQLLKSGIIL